MRVWGGLLALILGAAALGVLAPGAAADDTCVGGDLACVGQSSAGGDGCGGGPAFETTSVTAFGGAFSVQHIQRCFEGPTWHYEGHQVVASGPYLLANVNVLNGTSEESGDRERAMLHVSAGGYDLPGGSVYVHRERDDAHETCEVRANSSVTGPLVNEDCSGLPA